MSNANNPITLTPLTYSEELVLRVNELYYDFTHEQYGAIHSEMGSNEKERWERIAQQFLVFPYPVTIADFGTGNGFVPLTIGPFLRSHDTMYCADISTGMLEVARRNINTAALAPDFEFVKIGSDAPLRLPFDSAMLDAITMNSVLHHIRNTDEFLAEIDRILKPGGMLLIGHEPNKRFTQQNFLRWNHRFFSSLVIPKIGVIKLSRKLRMYAPVMKFYYRFFPTKGERSRIMMEQINKVLLREKIVRRPIELEELADITDILDREGFIPEQLLAGYEILLLESYAYLREVNRHYPNNRLIGWYDKQLAKCYPNSGGTFFAVLRKPTS